MAFTTPVPYIDQFGIHVPDFNTILNYFKDGYKLIYGSDTYLENDAQDGQLIGLWSQAMNDANAMAVQVYNSYSPASARGTGLSSVVKTNGIARELPSNSSADVLVVGQAFITILGGKVSDTDGAELWSLPPTVLIPFEGQILVTATADTPGSITAQAGTLTRIATPTYGWQSATNPTAADIGDPVELDPQLRVRQSQSTMLAAQTVLDGIIGAVAGIPGVSRLRGYENDGNISDVNSQPGHTISLVVDGGDALAIAQTISNRKTPGGGTYGSTSVVLVSSQGIPKTINFFRPGTPLIRWGLTVKAGSGFTTDIQLAIQQSMVAWTNALGIGNSVQFTRSYAAAYLTSLPQWKVNTDFKLNDVVSNLGALFKCTTAGTSSPTGTGPQGINTTISDGAAVWSYIANQALASSTYKVTSLTVARDSNSLTAADVVLSFIEAARSDVGNVAITVI